MIKIAPYFCPLSPKFTQWKYENEWRFLNNGGSFQHKNIIALSECFSRISSIIFGCKMDETEREEIIRICKGKKDELLPSFKEAIFDRKENFLHIVPYVSKEIE